jgi:hypothetical protein
MMSTPRLLGLLALAAFPGMTAAGAEFAVDAAGLDKAIVPYRDASRISSFPVPVVMARRAGLSAGAAEAAEIRTKILYPLIEASRKPISAIVLEWYPAQPDALGVIVVWTDGETRESLIARSPQGRYEADAYRTLLAKPTP